MYSPSMCRLGSVFNDLAPIRRGISSAPPCCSPDTQSLGLLLRRVLEEQRGGAAKILRKVGSRAWEQSLRMPNLDKSLMVLIIRSVHLRNTTSTGIAFVS